MERGGPDSNRPRRTVALIAGSSIALSIVAGVMLGVGLAGSALELLAAALCAAGSLLLLGLAVGRIRSSAT